MIGIIGIMVAAVQLESHSVSVVVAVAVTAQLRLQYGAHHGSYDFGSHSYVGRSHSYDSDYDYGNYCGEL